MKLGPVFFCLFFLLSPFALMGQGASAKSNSLPPVFIIGEHELKYEKLLENSPNMLLTVCDYNMDKAHQKWSEFLVSMEEYSESINFDIKGTKIWMNVFFKKDGNISHIAYYLKPKSRNIKTAELTAFFKSFLKRNRIDLVFSDSFYHSGHAAFPVHRKFQTKQ